MPFQLHWSRSSESESGRTGCRVWPVNFWGLEEGASLAISAHTSVVVTLGELLQWLLSLWQTSDIIHFTESVRTKPYLLAKLMRKESSMRQ